MKTYSGNIRKLYESKQGFEKIQAGKTYISMKGNKYSVHEIFIDAKSLKPDAIVSYEFETEDGQKGNEENSFVIFIDMLRNS